MKKMEIIAIRKKLMDLEGRASNIWIPGTLEREKPRSGTEVVKDRNQKNSSVMNKEHTLFQGNLVQNPPLRGIPLVKLLNLKEFFTHQVDKTSCL